MRFVQGPQTRPQFTKEDVRAPFRILVILEGGGVVPLSWAARFLSLAVPFQRGLATLVAPIPRR